MPCTHFVWAYQKNYQCSTRHIFYGVVLHNIINGSALIAHDRIKGTTRSVLIACDHNSEWRAVYFAVLHEQGKYTWSSSFSQHYVFCHYHHLAVIDYMYMYRRVEPAPTIAQPC